jgi:prepilin-type N-terminal cleavage/methylation domain-containing protein
MDKIFKKEGFTLIEILVVLSIIGILLSIVYVNFNDSRIEAKNKAMQSDLKAVQLALELYKAQTGAYPPNPTNTAYPAPLNVLVPDFIAKLPRAADSANPTNCAITYRAPAGGAWYKLTAARCHGGANSQAEGIQPDDGFARCLSAPTCPTCDATYRATRDFYESYAVYSLGGQCE